MSGSDHERGARRLLAALGLLRGGERRGSETRPRRARIEPTTRAEIQRRTVFGADGADGLPACVPALGPASTRAFPRQCPLERSRARILPTHRRSHARRRARVHRVRRINGLLTTLTAPTHPSSPHARGVTGSTFSRGALATPIVPQARASFGAPPRVVGAPFASACGALSFFMFIGIFRFTCVRSRCAASTTTTRRRGDAATRRRVSVGVPSPFFDES